MLAWVCAAKQELGGIQLLEAGVLASNFLRAAPVAAAVLLFTVPGSAFAAKPAPARKAVNAAPWANGQPNSLTGSGSFSDQHGTPANHLPAVRENIDVVGRLTVDTPEEFRTDEHPLPVEEGQIADLAIYKQAAYLNSWAEPAEEDDTCHRGGFFSVDISNPASPQQLAFVPALPETYHGEGAHVVTFNGKDILAVNNEPCGVNGVGGFDLYDVTNPANPVTLVQGAGDQSSDEPAGIGLGDTEQDPAVVPNSAHSIFLWQNGPKLYAVIVDNTELHDVDIFDVSNPSAPEFIADIDLVPLAEEQGFDLLDNGANGNAVFHHDMVVKKIGSVQTMLVSYWDAGYVKLNVNDPTSPTFIGDSDFGTVDPLTGFEPPEGNGHEAEFSHDNKYVLAADEDFSTYRTDFEITTGPNAATYESGEFGFSIPITTLPDKKLDGPVVYGGYGCDANDQIPVADTAIPPGSLAAGEEQIVVIQRGPVNDPAHVYPGCRFDEKMQNAIDKGYEGIIIANHHNGAGNGTAPDAAFCGSGDPRSIRGMCIGHRAFHLVFNDTPDYDSDYTPNSEPAIGTVGQKVAVTAVFDGWGFTHLYRNTGGDLEPIDDFAIDEGLDERYASGFGDLSVHEFATDATENVAYSAYYAGGMRVFTFGESGLQQTGKFIDEGGSNFWGVEQFTTPQGERLFAGSDRDSGLYLFRYTGPGAAAKPVCSNQSVTVPFQTPLIVSLTCTDANGNALTRSAGSASHGTVSGNANTGTITYTPAAGYSGPDSFTFTASDGAATSNPATVSITVTGGPTGCANQILGTPARDLIAGTDASDRVRAGAGDDVVDARKGDDCLFGEAGSDNVDGQDGNDIAHGSSGADGLLGGAGADQLFGEADVDRLGGGAGNDRLSGGSSRDILSGGSGADSLFGSSGNDTLAGGTGNDRISAGSGNDRISGNAGADRITPGTGADRVIAGAGNDRISARDGRRDRISCGSGRDTVTADRIDVLRSCESISRR